MPIIALPAHFDGERICLDEPFDLEPNTRLIVTVLPKQGLDNEREAWLLLSGKKLEDAYDKDEPEYPLDSVKEVNPGYEARFCFYEERTP